VIGRTPTRIGSSAALALAGGVIAGCGPFAATADCTSAVKYEGKVYEQVGYTYERDDVVGAADLAWCDDTGRSPRGNVFDATSKKVPVSALPGYDPDDVLVYAVSADLFQVLVATDVSKSEKKKIQDSDLLNAE
jgi:hypothetical protein